VQRWFRQRDYDRNLADGRRLVDRLLRRRGKADTVNLEQLAQRARFSKTDEFLAAVGRGDLTVGQVEHMLLEHLSPRSRSGAARSTRPAPEPTPQRPADDGSAPIVVDGIDNLQTRIAH